MSDRGSAKVDGGIGVLPTARHRDTLEQPPAHRYDGERRRHLPIRNHVPCADGDRSSVPRHAYRVATKGALVPRRDDSVRSSCDEVRGPERRRLRPEHFVSACGPLHPFTEGVLDELPLAAAIGLHEGDRAEPVTAVDDLAAVRVSDLATVGRPGNITKRILQPAVDRANEALVKAGYPEVSERITNHSLRRTFASLLYEAGASPAYVISQMGHTSSALALEVYARKMARSRDTGARMDALVQGADWDGVKEGFGEKVLSEPELVVTTGAENGS